MDTPPRPDVGWTKGPYPYYPGGPLVIPLPPTIPGTPQRSDILGSLPPLACVKNTRRERATEILFVGVLLGIASIAADILMMFIIGTLLAFLAIPFFVVGGIMRIGTKK